MMFEKGINLTQQTVDDAVWYWYALPFYAGHHWALLRLVFTDDASIGSSCHSLLTIVCCDFVKRSAPKNFWWFLSLPWTQADQQNLVVSSGYNCNC